MKLIKSKKGLAVIVALVVVAVAAVGAYAFLSDGGSGSGSATAGSVTNNLVIGTGTHAANPVLVGSGLLPGNSVAVSYSIYNPNNYSVTVTSVGASSITQSDSTCNAAPLNADFHYVDGGGADTVVIPAGGTAGPYSGTLSEDDDLSNNQDSCTAPNSTTLNLVSN